MVQPGVVLGQWWHRLDDGRIQCDLCPRECKLREGQRGFCFVRQLLDEFGSQRVAAIRFPVPFGPKSINERLRFLSPIYKLIRYHRLIFDSVADGVFRSTYLPWIDSITHVEIGEQEEIELRLNSNYENIWRVLKERLDEPAVRLKSHYSTRLYLWAKQYLVVGHKRVSVASLRKILGLEDVKDNSGKVVQDAPLELWQTLSNGRLIMP
jgi:Initiator Replication protein